MLTNKQFKTCISKSIKTWYPLTQDLMVAFIYHDEITKVTDEAGREYWREVEEEYQSDEGLNEFIEAAVQTRGEELGTKFNKTQSVANPSFGKEFMDQVLGGFDVSKYETETPWATARDGTRVSISIINRKDLVKLDGTDPLFLSGYGSYEIPNDPDFNIHILALLRGFVFAVAHIRGGGELGRKWYENGKLLCKKNTSTDFIDYAEYLLENKYGSKDKIAVQGRSAGGLLMGAVLTMRPDLFTTVIAEVAFVDVLTTMLDASIPLTTAESEEVKCEVRDSPVGILKGE